ncbi:hypothetical protein C1645_820756 [Glomus cerebriforme]|uniref:CCHC-type domain-containing protein n=1 Tax=Glomus cerebriforme TaxID=658196 RepID=A0A397T7U4_9GLOM|nr:hypothetical protein C1645_820756 [Glomus cerebriforme]
MTDKSFLEDLPDECRASKFQATELLKQPEINQGIFYLIALIQNDVDKWKQKSKSALNEKLFYGKKPRKGRPKGTKRIKSAIEPSKSNKNQRHCKICRQAGHYSSTCAQNEK